jgi:hypothetical protein
MKIDGLAVIDRVKVPLNQFFGGSDVWAEVRKYHPFAAAQIREESMKGMKFESFVTSSDEAQAGKKTAKISAIPLAEGMAEREMKVRNLKLEHGVTKHNMTSDGAACVWDKPLWDSLDNANPSILQYIVGKVDEQNEVASEDGDEADPT